MGETVTFHATHMYLGKGLRKGEPVPPMTVTGTLSAGTGPCWACKRESWAPVRGGGLVCRVCHPAPSHPVSLLPGIDPETGRLVRRVKKVRA